MTNTQFTIIEACDCIDNLNEKYYNSTNDEERLPFTFVYADYWMGIKYFEEIVWDNQDNDCEYITDNFDDKDFDKKESIMECVTRRVNKIHSITRNFNL